MYLSHFSSLVSLLCFGVLAIEAYFRYSSFPSKKICIVFTLKIKCPERLNTFPVSLVSLVETNNTLQLCAKTTCNFKQVIVVMSEQANEPQYGSHI